MERQTLCMRATCRSLDVDVHRCSPSRKKHILLQPSQTSCQTSPIEKNQGAMCSSHAPTRGAPRNIYNTFVRSP